MNVIEIYNNKSKYDCCFSDECKDHSQLCSRVKTMNMCRVPLYQKQCCQSCH